MFISTVAVCFCFALLPGFAQIILFLSRLIFLISDTGWTSGTTDTLFYYGGGFADAEDVIIVTVNYRMNIFGFPGLPGHPPNLGLLDQRLAVEWVKQNIRAFGGDPDRITISGQSCGSASVDYWAYAYRSKPLVAGLISHSGTALSFPTNNRTTAASHWYTVSAQLGCGSSGDVLSCMRQQNAMLPAP